MADTPTDHGCYDPVADRYCNRCEARMNGVRLTFDVGRYRTLDEQKEIEEQGRSLHSPHNPLFRGVETVVRGIRDLARRERALDEWARR